LIMGDIYSLNLGLAMFHMMKTTYIPHGPEHRKSWKVDLTICSIDRNTPNNDTGQSKSKMRTRAYIYSDHVAHVNSSSSPRAMVAGGLIHPRGSQLAVREL